MKKYQVAIIGTNIGAKHFEDFQKVSDRFNVHTLCGLTRDSIDKILACLLYTSPSPRDRTRSPMPSSA